MRAKVEPGLSAAAGGTHFQFERLGYFFTDPVDHAAAAPVFNRVVTLKDSWSRAAGDAAGDDLDARRAEKEAEKDAQAARSAAGLKAPEDIARERGADHHARFASLTGAGVPPKIALGISNTPEATAFVQAAPSYARHAESTAKAYANYTVKASGDGNPPYDTAAFGAFVSYAVDNDLGGSAIKRAHDAMVASGRFDPDAASGLDDDALAETVNTVVETHSAEAERFRAGEAKLLGFFVGQVMRATGGKADGNAVRKALQARLSGS